MKNTEKSSFELKNDLTQIELLFCKLKAFSKANGFSKRTFHEINLAVEELFTNIVTYGYADEDDHLVQIDMLLKDDRLYITITDDGIAFDPVKAKDPDCKCPLEQTKIGGMGIYLTKKLMDKVEYQRDQGRNWIKLEKMIV